MGLKIPSASTTGIITFVLGELNELTPEEEPELKNEILSFKKDDSGFGTQLYSCVWSTSLCLLGLLSLKDISRQDIEESIRYLCRNQSESGGWSFSGREEDRIIYTSSSVSALLRYLKRFNDQSVRHNLERAYDYARGFTAKNNIEKVMKEWLLRVIEESGIASSRKHGNETEINFAEIIENEFRKYIILETSIYPFSMVHYTPVTYLFTRKFLQPTHPFNLYLIKYLIKNQVDGRFWSHVISHKKNIPYSFCTAHSILTLFFWARDILEKKVEFRRFPSFSSLRSQIEAINYRVPRLFVSYSENDKAKAERIVKALERKGYPVWFADHQIGTGDSIVGKIEEGLEKSDYQLVLLSKSSVKSKWVKEELNFGMTKEIEDGKTFVLPILLEDCKRPPVLYHKKYADFRKSFDEGINEIVRILEVAEKDREVR